MQVVWVKMAQLGQTVSMYQNLNTQNTNINEVAFSGSYTDLANTPVISAVGHSGQYSDVLKPPTRVSQFANDANHAVIGQKVSEFQNDANYAIVGQNVSEFANNSNYTVQGSNISQFANNSNYAIRGENVSEFANNSNYAVRGENISEFSNNVPYATTAQLSSATATSGNVTNPSGAIKIVSGQYQSNTSCPPSTSFTSQGTTSFSLPLGYTLNNPPLVVVSSTNNNVVIGTSFYRSTSSVNVGVTNLNSTTQNVGPINFIAIGN